MMPATKGSFKTVALVYCYSLQNKLRTLQSITLIFLVKANSGYDMLEKNQCLNNLTTYNLVWLENLSHLAPNYIYNYIPHYFTS